MGSRWRRRTRPSPAPWPASPCRWRPAAICDPAWRGLKSPLPGASASTRAALPPPPQPRGPMDNPLLDFSGLPRFDQIRPEHVGPAVDTLLEQAEARSEEHTSELQSRENLVCRL